VSDFEKYLPTSISRSTAIESPQPAAIAAPELALDSAAPVSLANAYTLAVNTTVRMAIQSTSFITRDPQATSAPVESPERVPASGGGPARPLAIRVGPAGWSYPDWEGVVYPRRKPKGFHPLRALARWFDCVEINSSFYATPSARNAEHWAELVADRPRFRFTAKLQRIFTHEPLPTGEAEVRAFHEGLQPLADARRLAALLVQLPRTFARAEAAEGRLAWIAERFGGWPLVLELRHRSWFEPEPLARVRELGYALCGIDLPDGADRPAEDQLAGVGERVAPRPLAYLRLHGRNRDAWFDPRATRDRKYDYLYAPEEVRELADATRRIASGAEETYVITNNHFTGKAVVNGLELLAELGGAPVLGPVELLDAYPRLRARVKPDGQDTLFGA
jgi:uncharacterized protein YecE (DUF72 family)